MLMKKKKKFLDCTCLFLINISLLRAVYLLSPDKISCKTKTFIDILCPKQQIKKVLCH